MTGGPLNLSLLSRGVGEVQKNGHEKVEVFLEPEDYYNFSKNVENFYLPPIHSTYPSFLASTPGFTARSSREAQEFRVPKTFTTRKGALLLFSEDLAQRNMERAAAKRKAVQHSQPATITPSTSLDSQVDLRTVEDLAHSILKYGSHDRADDKICLKFLHARRDNFDRQIRPGFSAKRYLSTWTKTWDDTVFDNVIKQGYITERSLYHYNLVLPHLRRRLFHEDLSHMPQPYRLMRNMLMAPGSLSGYTFYRAPTMDLGETIEEEDEMRLVRRRGKLQSIRVVKTQGGIQEEVMYSDLDRQSQKEVITDLLVKSAVHYALQKQEEIYQESVIRAIHTEQNNVDDDGFGVKQQPTVVRAADFDMQNAVESLLDSQNGRLAIGADLPEIDDRSQVSEMAGSFKGSTTIPHHLAKQNASQRPSWPTESGPAEKEYMGGVPVASMKDGSAASDASSHHSSVPQLPPIRHTLSPIHDVSRENTQPYITLPPIGRDELSTNPPTVTVVPATPQHSTLMGSSSREGFPSDAATRGLLSRDAFGTQDLLEEDETETEQEPDHDKKKEKKKEQSSSSVPSSGRGKGKSSIHAGEGGEAAAHAVGGSSTGTARSRPQWKAGTRRGIDSSSPTSSISSGSVFSLTLKKVHLINKQPPPPPSPPQQQENESVLEQSQEYLNNEVLQLQQQEQQQQEQLQQQQLQKEQQQQLQQEQQQQKQQQQQQQKLQKPLQQLGLGVLFNPPLTQTKNGPSSMHGHACLSHHNQSEHSGSGHHSTHGPVHTGASWVWDRDGNRKARHRKTAGSVVESFKGSMVMAPDGEIISVGGSVARGGAGVTDVGNLNDVPTGYRLEGIGGNATDDSAASDDEPDEWKNTKKFSISTKSDSLKKVIKRGSVSGSSVAKSDLERLGSAGKQILWDHASQAASEIDYKSGDIDATMSMHSWSYAVPEHDEFGLPHATSVRSLPGLQLEGGGGTKDTLSTADGQNDTHLSTESSDGEHWAKITERPEEEEIANIESREITMEEIEIPRVPSPSPASELKTEDDGGVNETIHEDDEGELGAGESRETAAEKDASTPRSKSIGLQTDSDAGSYVKGKYDISKGLASKTPKTPGRSTGFDADDEHDDDEEENGWLEVVKEASVEQSSRKASVISKVETSQSGSKTASASRVESKVESVAEKGQDATKSAAPSVASERKSVAAVEGKLPESGAVTPAAEAVTEEIANEKPGSEGEASAQDAKAGSVQEKARSVSQKSKSGTAVSGDKSQPSSTGGRVSADTGSPTKGVKSASGKGDKSASLKGDKSARSKGDASVSAHSSKKSKRSDSQTKIASRATTGTKVSPAKLTTPPATADAEGEGVENFEDNPWADNDDDDVEIDDEREKDGGDLNNEFRGMEDTEEYRMPSTPSEDNAKISGEDNRRGSNLDLTIAGQQLLTPPSTPSKSKKKRDSTDRETLSRHSSVTEKDIMDTLTDHAQRIAESVLSQPAAGLDLQADVKQAANMWAEMHPPRPVSRANSVREFRADAIQEIMRNRRASSAAPSAAEYKAMIKKSLTTAVAKAAGLDPDTISDDAEISPELLEALASQKLTPDQIEIVSDSEGRTRIQSRVDASDIQAVQEGHLFIAPGKEDTGVIKRQVSIPADRVSIVDDVEIDRISYQGTDAGSEKGEKRSTRSKAGSKPGSKAGSIAGGTMADLREMEGMMAELEGKVENSGNAEISPDHVDDFLAAVQMAEGKTVPSPPLSKRTSSGKTTPSAMEETPAAKVEEEEKKGSPLLPEGGDEKKAEDLQSVKSGKTGVSQKSSGSKDSKKKEKEKEEPFVVAAAKQLTPAPSPPPPPPPALVEEVKVETSAPVADPEKDKVEDEKTKELTPRPLATGAGATTPREKEAALPAAGTGSEAVAAEAAEGPKSDGLMDHMDELTKLYGGKMPPAPPPPKPESTKGKPREKKPKKEPVAPKKKVKKSKKAKKKEEQDALMEQMRNEIEGNAEEPPPPPPPAPVVDKEPTPRGPSPVTSEPKASSPEFRTDESDGEFQFVREASSPEMDVPQTRLQIPSPPIEEEDDKSDEEAADNDDSGLKAISNREARAAKRAAAAAKRREEVERRRREKEEHTKKEKEEVERQVALQREMEEERRRREEERRLRKEHQKEAELREQKELEEAQRRVSMEADREKKAKEEYQRKLEEIRRKQQEEEIRRHELNLQRQREEEERRLAEEELMSEMAAQERIEYERKKKEEEEERKRKEEEERLRRIEEAKRAMEEAQRLAEEMARKQAELEARLKFNRDLQVESSCMTHSQGINRAFVFSYFELLQWLGLDIPEFELAKLADY